MNNRQLLINGIKACGWVQDTTAKTSKYLVFVRSDDRRPGGTRLLVGKSGALRVCRDGAPISQSRSLTDSKAARAHRYVGHPGFKWQSTEQALGVYQDLIAGKITAPGV